MKNEKTILGSIKIFSELTPNKLALIDPKLELTYKEYWDKIFSIATNLKNDGLEKDELVIVKNGQSVEYMTLLHGIQLAGGIAIPIEKSANEGRALELLKETGATKFYGDIEVEGYETLSISEIYNKLAAAEWEDKILMPVEDDEAMVLFTTGTTGKSKGIVLQYSAEFAVAENVMYGVEMKKDNVEIIPMPMNHSFSLRRYFANMINGSTVILIDGVFFAKIIFQMIEKYKVTAMAMAPAAISIIFKLTKDKIADYADQLDYLQFGSAPLPEADKEHLLEILPNIRMYNIYGSTEAGCSCSLNFNSEDNRPQCIGHPTKNSIFKIVDENGEEFEATLETPGYLYYTGGMAMKNYYKDEILTGETLQDGYLKSKDLGYRDREGRIYMIGRADDVIISGGNKISPLEVEEVAKKVKGVLDCICKKKEDSIIGAVPVLYVVASDDLDMNKLEAYLFNHLEDFKRPREIALIEVVPRTYNGKVDRLKEVKALSSK